MKLAFFLIVKAEYGHFGKVFKFERVNPCLLILFYLFICQRKRESEGKHKQGDQQAEGEAKSLLSREPDNIGLDSMTPRSRPELKTDTLLSQPGAPRVSS